MMSMRPPLFDAAAAFVFALFGVAFGYAAVSDAPISFVEFTLTTSAEWAVTGLSFVMAYFAVVHMRRS